MQVGERTQLDPDSQTVDVDDMAFEGVEDESVKGLSGVIESLKEQSDSLQKSVAAISARLNSDETPEWAKQVLFLFLLPFFVAASDSPDTAFVSRSYSSQVRWLKILMT